MRISLLATLILVMSMGSQRLLAQTKDGSHLGLVSMHDDEILRYSLCADDSFNECIIIKSFSVEDSKTIQDQYKADYAAALVGGAGLGGIIGAFATPLLGVTAGTLLVPASAASTFKFYSYVVGAPVGALVGAVIGYRYTNDEWVQKGRLKIGYTITEQELYEAINASEEVLTYRHSEEYERVLEDMTLAP